MNAAPVYPKWICFLLFFVLISLGADGQKVSVELLKGNKIEGIIISYTYGDTLHLMVNGQYPIKIPESGIKAITFPNQKKHDTFSSKKWLNTSRVAMDFGATSNSPSFSHTVSKRLFSNINLFAGVGIGIDNYYLSDLYNVIPIFGSIKYYFIKQRFSPFIDIRYGYGQPWPFEDSASGGKHFNPIIGYRIGGSGMMVEITGGLKFQKLDYEFISATEVSEFDILVKRAQLGLNFTF
ncbi:MAG TPA: hypothetical protein PLY70_01370 [Saprospiraceae bacterium]|nr:hypothetical protein [Saprospiraceae bacterium]HPN68582.1 hypothetical protein [Saprospiraceae bacterium]